MKDAIRAPRRIYGPRNADGVRALLYPEGAEVPADRAAALGLAGGDPAKGTSAKKPPAKGRKRGKRGPAEDRAGRPAEERDPQSSLITDSPQEAFDG